MKNEGCCGHSGVEMKMSDGLVVCLGLLIGGVGGICLAIIIDWWLKEEV